MTNVGLVYEPVARRARRRFEWPVAEVVLTQIRRRC